MDRICTSLSVYKNSSSYEVLLKLQKMICDFFALPDTIYCHGPFIRTGSLSRTVTPSHSPILVSLGLSLTVSWRVDDFLPHGMSQDSERVYNQSRL
jgi:hypothetical protein